MGSLAKSYPTAARTSTSAYHPRTNGKVERFNGILESYLFRMNTTGDKSRWDEFLDAALFASRIRHREGSKWSPFELLYGRKPRLARDKPVLRAHAKRQEATARETARAERDKRAFDARVPGGEDEPGWRSCPSPQ